jgi:N-acetylglucosamine kinase-like BadF-type ATPase
MTHHASHAVYLAIDAGGTHTRAVIATAGEGDPRIIGTGRAGPANWTTMGPEPCARAVGEAAAAALAQAGLSTSAVARAVVAMAGYYPPWHETEAREALAAVVPEVPLRLEPDLVAAWAGATSGRPGIALVAGTGAVAYGRDAAGRAARAGGWGPLFGDEGSGYWIGCEALRAAARALDGRGPSDFGSWILGFGLLTALTPIQNPRTKIQNREEALRAVYRDGWSREQIAALSVVVTRHASEGDMVALRILERAAAELGVLVEAVARRLEWGSERLPVALVGGVLESSAELREALRRWLGTVLPNACCTTPQGSPVQGALLLAHDGSG